MKKKLNLNIKSLPVILAGVILLSSIIGGEYYFWKLKDKPKDNGNNNPPQETSKITDLGDGWIKYENYVYGFSFEAPSYWSDRIDNHLKIGNSDSTLCLNEKDFEKPYQGCKQVIMHVYKTSITGKDLQTWYKDLETDQYIGANSIFGREKIMMSGVNTWKLKTSFDSKNIQLLLFKFDKNYVLSIILVPEISLDNDLVKRVLDSLKFT